VGEVSRGGKHRLPHRQWQLNFAEECLRIQIILAGLVNDPQQIVLPGRRTAKRDVDLPLLQRRLVGLIVDANDQLFCPAVFLLLKADA
jgi:hypothetical protein